MASKILLLGGGGHCRSVCSSVWRTGLYDEVGIVVKDLSDSESLTNQGRVVGTDSDLPALRDKGWTDAFVTVGSVGNTDVRHRLWDAILGCGFHVPVIVDPSAVVAEDVALQPGVFVGRGAVINAGSSVGRCAIINTGAVVEHDCVIGAFAHVSPGVTLCGQIRIGRDAHIGAGAVIRQQLRIGDHALIGIGSVVVCDIPGGVVAYGNPCRVVKNEGHDHSGSGREP